MVVIDAKVEQFVFGCVTVVLVFVEIQRLLAVTQCETVCFETTMIEVLRPYCKSPLRGGKHTPEKFSADRNGAERIFLFSYNCFVRKKKKKNFRTVLDREKFVAFHLLVLLYKAVPSSAVPGLSLSIIFTFSLFFS